MKVPVLWVEEKRYSKVRNKFFKVYYFRHQQSVRYSKAFFGNKRKRLAKIFKSSIWYPFEDIGFSGNQFFMIDADKYIL